jgi:hypothetical protein
MSDTLEQLLRDADSSISIPEIAAEHVSHRLRRKARNQRRVAACGLAMVVLAIASLPFLIVRHAPHPASNTIAVNLTSLQLDAAMHARIAELVESAERLPRPRVDPSDAFFGELKMQRNRAALVLLRDATRSLSDSDPLAAAATLRRTIQLFPDTPAAAAANKQLEQIRPPMRQS